MTTDPRAYHFQVLGPVRAWHRGRRLELGPPKQRAVLALFLLYPGAVLRVPTIVKAIWGGTPPVNVENAVQVYVSRIRRVLGTGHAGGASRLLTVPSGYRLLLDPEWVDFHRFQALVTRARALRAERRLAGALDAFQQALALWQEDPLTEIDEGIRQRMNVSSLVRHRRQAVIELADTAIGAGRAEVAVPSLEAMAELDPTDEPAYAKLILAYAATGRRAAALNAYETIRTVLAETLGVDPSDLLRQAHTTVLRR